jgi:hypothetical protein
MKTTMRPLLFALACVALTYASGACSDDPPPPVEAEPGPPEQPAAPAPADIEPSEEEVPIVEDFEDEAEKEVKPDNLNAQLDALEQEIELDSK